MRRFLIFMILTYQFVLGQSKIQHEPERLFNGIDLGITLSDFVQKYDIHKIEFLRDTVLSSSRSFDKKGNNIEHIGFENSSVYRTTNTFNKENQLIEIKHYYPDESFNYGYYYKHEEGLRSTYIIEDSLLFRKAAHFIPENIRIYSQYRKDGTLQLKNVYVYDDQDRYLLETRFSDKTIEVQYRYEYVNDKKYVTKVDFNSNGEKTREKRHLDEEKVLNGTKINKYRESTETISRVEFLNSENKLVKMELYDNDHSLYRVESREYDSNDLLKKKVKEDLIRKEKIEYTYFYDDQNRIKRIEKTSEGNFENFEYRYITNN